jgi:hypothetical protein
VCHFYLLCKTTVDPACDVSTKNLLTSCSWRLYDAADGTKIFEICKISFFIKQFQASWNLFYICILICWLYGILRGAYCIRHLWIFDALQRKKITEMIGPFFLLSSWYLQQWCVQLFWHIKIRIVILSFWHPTSMHSLPYVCILFPMKFAPLSGASFE